VKATSTTATRFALACRDGDCQGLELTDPDACPGWAIMEGGDGEPRIEVCDDCAYGLQSGPFNIYLDDDDVALLPEAVEALREALE
jgi:hypothetical protein